MQSSCLVIVCSCLLLIPPAHTAQNQPDQVSDQAQAEKGPTEAPVPSSSSAAAAIEAAPLVIPEATPVKLKLLHSLSSKTVVVDDPLNFAVAEDVVVEGRTLIKAGAVAIGRVREAKPARMLGRGGQLSLEMQYVKVGPTRIPLRGTQTRAGENKKGDTVALVALFGLSGLVKHGSETEVKEGSLFTAYVDQTVPLTAHSDTASQNP